MARGSWAVAFIRWPLAPATPFSAMSFMSPLNALSGDVASSVHIAGLPGGTTTPTPPGTAGAGSTDCSGSSWNKRLEIPRKRRTASTPGSTKSEDQQATCANRGSLPGAWLASNTAAGAACAALRLALAASGPKSPWVSNIRVVAPVLSFLQAEQFELPRRLALNTPVVVGVKSDNAGLSRGGVDGFG